MAKKSGRKYRDKSKETASNQRPGTQPWLSKRTGLIIMAVLSLGLAILILWQLYPEMGLGQALVWAAGFSLSLWVVFFMFYIFNIWIRGRSD